jgi:hypothetical protein
MSLVGNISSVFNNGLKGLSKLPACVRDIAVAWYKNLDNIVDSSYVKDEIGSVTRTIYYGQYLTSASGQINLYRTSGTYDYIDPSTGNSVTGNSIPGTGLISVPANGICEITTSDGSRYPVCERAGTVLHDVLENSTHISVATPTWDETLYGSDYLNQVGYVTKTQSDDDGYDWETEVNGSDVTLDNNTLVPFGLWEYVNLQDVNGNNLLDISGNQLQVRNNI